MKAFRLLILIALLGIVGRVNAQTELLGQREEKLKELSGKARVQEALNLSREYYVARDLEKSAEMAGLAYTEAAIENDSEAMAQALSLESKALLADLDLRPAQRLKAIKKLQESTSLTSRIALKLENLKLLRQVYAQIGKNKELREVEREIARLTAEQNKGLEQELAVASQEKEKMTEVQASLAKTLDQIEGAIQSMTESQAKSELLLAQQKSILDSMAFLSMIDSLKLSQQDMLLSEQEAILREREAQLGMQKAQRNFFVSLTALVLVLAGGLTIRYFSMQRYNRVIAAEKQRSDDLLLNILPQKVADELKLNGKAQAQFFENASVLFVDFEGFSQFAANLPPRELVETLDFCFQRFDQISAKYGLEKIKTIGDAYMAAGGLPSPDPANPQKVVDAALEIKEFLDEWKEEREAEGKPYLRARIGIHTGPLVAGVVGKKKFAYDIWGDTVNVASRMESSGVSGKVNVSASTYDEIKDEFECEHRGKIPIKNLGELDMYFVEKKVKSEG
ncbi:MAG: hypothetical protein IPH04_03165 [Saprospirales bacterium]|nr:hypothetical protein [Saprospirales bacterium]